jgi:hypothetical protein
LDHSLEEIGRSVLGGQAATNQSLDRRKSIVVRILLSVIETASLCWPTLINQGAVLVFPDTRTYYVAGRAALTKGLALLHPHATGDAGGDTLETAIQKARAVRSVFYSLFTYISGDVLSLWLAVGIQAVLLAWTLRFTFDLMCPQRPRWHATGFILTLAFLTTASWVVSSAMPDVFTPIAVLCATIIILFWNRLGATRRLALFALLVAGLVMHLTNPPVILALLMVGALLRLNQLWRDRAGYASVGAAVVIALAATLVASVIGFKQWTLTPNAPPFLLARSLDDGPGKLYLQAHCPQIGLDMCKHLDRLDVGDEDFIWHQNGVYSAVPLDEAAVLRTEDKRIYIAAALEHPWMQLRAILTNSLRQLGFFTLWEYFIPSFAYADPTNPPDMLTMYIRPTEPAWEMYLAIPEYLIVIASFMYGCYRWSRGLLRAVDRSFCALVLTAVIANAIVCSFSNPSPRYEARVIWLIPMTALLFAYRPRVGDRT